MVEEEAKRRGVEEIVSFSSSSSSFSSSSSSSSSNKRWKVTKNYHWVTEVRGGIRYNTLKKLKKEQQEVVKTEAVGEDERKQNNVHTKSQLRLVPRIKVTETEVRGGIRFNTLKKVETDHEEVGETKTVSEAEVKRCGGGLKTHR